MGDDGDDDDDDDDDHGWTGKILRTSTAKATHEPRHYAHHAVVFPVQGLLVGIQEGHQRLPQQSKHTEQRKQNKQIRRETKKTNT